MTTDHETLANRKRHRTNTEGVRTIWLNRPDVRNAMNDVLIAELNQAIEAAMSDDARSGSSYLPDAARHSVLRRRSGLDEIGQADDTADQSAQDTGALARMPCDRSMKACQSPSVARIHGSAFAGALGLVTACDIAIGQRRNTIQPVRSQTRSDPGNDQSRMSPKPWAKPTHAA